MKLSILIFVLATSIYGCQCAPNPSWREDLEAARHLREESMKQAHERLEEAKRTIEESRNQLHAQSKARKLQLEEFWKNIHEQLAAGRQQRKETREQWEATGNSPMITVAINNKTINGVHTFHHVQEQLVNHVRERTITDYSSTTNKTEIKKYKCTSSTDSSCTLESTETKDGAPDQMNHFNSQYVYSG